MAAINAAIENGDSSQLMRVLQNQASQLPPVFDFAASLYLEEFRSIRAEKQVCQLISFPSFLLLQRDNSKIQICNTELDKVKKKEGRTF